MTTAGRPTWNTARGTKGKWEKDLSAMSKQYSVRDLPAHTKLKTRQAGQGRPEDLHGVDFKKELEEKELRLANEKSQNKNKRQLAIGSSSSASSKATSAKKGRGDVSTANLDADDPWEEDYEEDTRKEEDDDAENSDASDSDEDEELLLAELNKIKRERAEEAAKMAERAKQEEETIRLENLVKGNPLLNNDGSFKVKKKWDDDVVFKNCARGAVDHSKRGYVNNMLRSDFHRKFMKKYIQ